MFYLSKRQDEKQCTLGEKAMVLADFPAIGIKAGTIGVVCEIYDGGVMLRWPTTEHDRMFDRKGACDGFGRDELEYLAFETSKHPKVDPTVNRDPSRV